MLAVIAAYSIYGLTTTQRLHSERSQTSLYSRSTVGRLAFRVAQKRCDLLRSLFWCDRKTAIERDHAATASDQTKFKVAEGRSKVAVRCDWGGLYKAHDVLIDPLRIGHEQVSWHKNIKYLGVQFGSVCRLITISLFENFMLPPMLFVVM